MAAGLGFKDFTTGEVLTAADVDGYLMQGIWVFASAAARDAAVTSPQEGNFAYLKDTNVTTYYTGSAWTNLDTTGMVNPMTTTGDTIYSSSGSTPARLGIGTAGQILRVNSGATAPEWATVSSGGMTLLETLTLSGASVTSSSISQSYKNLQVIIRNARPATGGTYLGFRMNSATTGYASESGTQTTGNFNGVAIYWGDQISSSTSNLTAWINIYDYTNTTTWKTVDLWGYGNSNANSANWSARGGKAIFNTTSAITTITLFPDSGNWTSGSALIYGVS